MIEPNNCYLMDCKEGMEQMLEQGLIADWVITDPPYGIGGGGVLKQNYTKSGSNKAKRRDYSDVENWDTERIPLALIDLIFNVSKDQIIFGGNYYTDIFPPTRHWAIWDKRLPTKTDRVDQADAEMAWASKGGTRVFNYRYNGFMQDDKISPDKRFHPTQKPHQMWLKILEFYTKEGDLILDPFAGSQSLRIACYKMKRNYIGFEKEKVYYEKGTAWFNQVSAQISMFDGGNL